MTSNPMINNRVVENVILEGQPMTVAGAVNKTLLLLLIVVACGFYTWSLCAQGFGDKANLITTISLIAGFVLALITCFKPNTSNITAPAYAVCEGLLIGSVSFMYNALYNGIVVQAIVATLAALFSMLLLYKSKVIQATDKFRKVIFTATLGIAIFYIVGIIAAFLHHPMTLFNGGMLGIIVSAVICVIAALNFILDFDFIERGSNMPLPNYFEWYGAFSLLVTVIWLYLEILRLLAQLNRRN